MALALEIYGADFIDDWPNCRFMMNNTFAEQPADLVAFGYAHGTLYRRSQTGKAGEPGDAGRSGSPGLRDWSAAELGGADLICI